MGADQPLEFAESRSGQQGTRSGALGGLLASSNGIEDAEQDIDGVIAALFNPDQYALNYPACNILCGDMNGDGAVNGQDIDGFVAALFGQ